MIPFSCKALPTFGPTISTLRILYSPVDFKIVLTSSPISLPKVVVDVGIFMIISLSLPNFVTTAFSNFLFVDKRSLILSIGAVFVY